MNYYCGLGEVGYDENFNVPYLCTKLDFVPIIIGGQEFCVSRKPNLKMHGEQYDSAPNHSACERMGMKLVPEDTVDCNGNDFCSGHSTLCSYN